MFLCVTIMKTCKTKKTAQCKAFYKIGINDKNKCLYTLYIYLKYLLATFDTIPPNNTNSATRATTCNLGPKKSTLLLRF